MYAKSVCIYTDPVLVTQDCCSIFTLDLAGAELHTYSYIILDEFAKTLFCQTDLLVDLPNFSLANFSSFMILEIHSQNAATDGDFYQGIVVAGNTVR